MGRRLQIEKGQAATLVHYPAEGVPTGATVSLYYSGTSPQIDAAAATVDSYDEAIAGVDKWAREITVSSAPTIGERYWLADDLGTGQEIHCAGGNGTTFVLSEKLARAVDSGTIKGRRISYSLSATHTQSLRRRMRLRWAYSVNGQPVVVNELVDVVLWPFDLILTEEDIESKCPSWGELSSQHGAWRKLVGGAIDYVWDYLAGMQLEPDQVFDRDLLKPVAIYWLLRQRHIGDDAKFKDYDKLLREAKEAFAASKAWYDANEDAARNRPGTVIDTYVDDGGNVVTVTAPGEAGAGGYDESRGTPIQYMRVG